MVKCLHFCFLFKTTLTTILNLIENFDVFHLFPSVVTPTSTTRCLRVGSICCEIEDLPLSRHTIMSLPLIVVIVLFLLSFLWNRVIYHRTKQYVDFPQIPPSRILGHLSTLIHFMKTTKFNSHFGWFRSLPGFEQ